MIEGIKSVFVGLVEDGSGSRSTVLAYGLSLAQAAGAHLTVEAACLRHLLHDAFKSDIATQLVGDENQRLRRLVADVADRVHHDAALAGLAHSIDTMQLPYDGLAEKFVSRARLHDVSVLDAGKDTVAIARGLTEAVLFDSGRPVIVVRPGQHSFAARRVLVAWDGSVPVTRALASAMPILRAAGAVELISVLGEKAIAGSLLGCELAPCLARHGVSVTVKDVEVADGDVAKALGAEAERADADLIVMGAYKHSRLREWVLGGVTQSMLKRSPVPLFMSH